MMNKRGITLTELLIALGLLGLIAMFAVPKVLNSSGGNAAWSASAKEAIRMFKDGYDLYRIENRVEPDAYLIPDMTPYFNYVGVDTVSDLDHVPGSASIDCSDTVNHMCLRLHSGATVLFNVWNHFGQNADNHYIFMFYDPDGKYSGNTSGPGKSVVLRLYNNGRITSSDHHTAGDTTYQFGSPQSYGADPKPDWFDWES